MTLPQTYIGVDVAKDWIDVFDPSTSQHERISTDSLSLRRFAAAVGKAIVVLEASGGYERPVITALHEAGRQAACVNLGRPGNLLVQQDAWPRVTALMQRSLQKWDEPSRWFPSHLAPPNASASQTLVLIAMTSPA